jgi:large subunit ribosomal protein L10Ae
MSKLNSELVEQSIDRIFAFAKGETFTVNDVEVKGKKRKFRETIELQIALKNYDPSKDKRFNGTFRLPAAPKPDLRICVLGHEQHCTEAKELGYDAMSAEDLKKLNKNKKLVKKLAGRYDAFLASHSLIKQIPRLLGPGLNRAGKFPTLVAASDTLADKIEDVKCTIKFQMKKVLCLNTAIGHVEMEKEAVIRNLNLSVNFLVSLLKKNWLNVKVLYIKSTMGPPQQIFF